MSAEEQQHIVVITIYIIIETCLFLMFQVTVARIQMDYEDTGTSDTSDSQAVLVIEFNNQATLKNGENVGNKENLEISENKNTW